MKKEQTWSVDVIAYSQIYVKLKGVIYVQKQ